VEQLYVITSKGKMCCLADAYYSLNVCIVGILTLMNKAQWNTVILDGSVPQGEVERMIDNSFMLVVSKMTKKEQTSILVQL
jgi:hypothetical protein